MHTYETGIDPHIPEDEQYGELWRQGDELHPVPIQISPQTVAEARRKLAEMTSGLPHHQDYTIKGVRAVDEYHQ